MHDRQRVLVLGDSGNKDLFDLLEYLLEYLIQLNN